MSTVNKRFRRYYYYTNQCTAKLIADAIISLHLEEEISHAFSDQKAAG